MNGPNSGIETKPLTEKQKARFWKKVKKSSPDKCWIWKGAKYLGYGRVNINGKNHKANRIALTIKIGSIPKGKVAAHSCDNPICVNPNHIFLTDQLGNVRDCINKNRINPAKGENHWRNKRKALAR